MSVRFTDNTPSVLAKNNRAVSLSIRLVMDQIDREAFRNTPMKTGELRKDIRKSVSGNRGVIRWAVDYAAYQERGYTSAPIRRYTTPGTGPRFAEKAVLKSSTKFPELYFRSAKL